jgi:type I restriction enzyme S subunit
MTLKTDSLAQMCEAVIDCPHSTPVWTGFGHIVLRNQNIKNGRLDLSSPSFTDDENFKHRTRRLAPRAGDIVITREAPMGDVCKIPEGLECCLGQRQVLLRPKSDVDSDYLLYALQSPFVQNQIRWNEGTGSTVSNIRIPILEKIDIPRLGDAEPRVAQILSVIDAKIDLNRQTNQTLEAMAQAIFKSWFVDFDPVKAKIAAIEAGQDPLRAAMSAISGKSDAELDTMPLPQYEELAATASLFPEELVESELGDVPKGWEVLKVGDISNKIAMGPFGSNIKVETFVDSGVPIISGQHLKSIILNDLDYKYITEEHSLKIANSIVFSGDIVFTHAGNIGQVSLIPEKTQFEKYVISQRQFYLRPNLDKVKPSYLVCFFKSPVGQHLLLANASQVGVPSISRPSSYLKSIELLVPNILILNEFDRLFDKKFQQIVLFRHQMELLSQLRDTLLPKLLSGKLSVAELEEAV